MRLVELTYFPGIDHKDQRGRLLVNPDHVIFLVQAHATQTWLRLAGHEQDFLIDGPLDEVAEKLVGKYADVDLVLETG